MKRFLLCIAICFIVFALIIMVPAKVNDINLIFFKADVENSITAPEKTEVVEFVSACGNSSGTGDHTDLYVAVLIKSELDFDDIVNHFTNDTYFWRMQSVENRGNQTIGMQCMNLKFETDTGDGENYYILEYNKGGILDWRG